MVGKGKLAWSVMGVVLLLAAPLPTAASLYDFLFRSVPADAEERAAIAADCENPALKSERIEVVELTYHTVARLIDRCEPGKYRQVCTTFVINPSKSSCRPAPPMGDYFGRFEGGPRDYIDLNNRFPPALKIQRKYIYGQDWEGAIIDLKGGNAVIFESTDDMRIFSIERQKPES